MNKISIKNNELKAYIHRFANKFGKQKKIKVVIKDEIRLKSCQGCNRVKDVLRNRSANCELKKKEKATIQVHLTMKASPDTSLT